MTQRASLDGSLPVVLERISDGFLTYDRDWRFTYLNRAAEEYFGCSRDELLGRVAWEVFPSSAGTEAQRQLMQAAARGVPAEFELLTPIKQRWVAFRTFPSPDGLAVYFRDVTEQRQARAALDESEARFRAVYEHSAEGILLTATDGQILAANPAAARLLGRSEAEICQLGRRGLVDPADPNLAGLLAERRRVGRAQGDLVMLRGDGSRFIAETSSVIFTLANGVERTCLTFHDVTQQRRAARALRFLAELGTRVSLDDGVTLSNLTALLVPELADLCAVDLIEAGGARRATEARRDGVAAPGDWEVAPRELAASVTATRIQVPIESSARTLGVLSLALDDQHTRRFAEDDLALAQAVAARVGLALENARLYRSALAAKGLRDEMLGIVSHDLRTPLNAIHLAAQLLARRHTGVELTMISRAIERANRLVQDLLTAALIDGGKLPLARGDEAIAGLLAEAVELHRAPAVAKQVELRVTTEDDLPLVSADRHRLLQAVSNLLSNAIRFAPEGSRVEVAARRVAGSVHITVADAGPGIAPDALAHVFDRFWQAAHHHEVGVGLGLAIVKGIIDAHGGTVEVESRPGEGATFTLTLPIPT